MRFCAESFFGNGLFFHTPDQLLIAAFGSYGFQAACDKEESSKVLMQAVGLKHRLDFLENYLQPALAEGFVETGLTSSPPNAGR